MQDRFRYLLDQGEREGAILAIREWITDEGPGPIVATTIERNLAAPLRWYLTTHPSGRTDTEAAAAMLLRADELAERLRHRQRITSKQIDALERAWLEMQAAVGLGWVATADKASAALSKAVAIADKARAKLSEAGARGAKEAHRKQAPTIEAAHARIARRAKLMRTGYSKTEALNILEKAFPEYTRRRIAEIVSSVFPKTRGRARPSA